MTRLSRVKDQDVFLLKRAFGINPFKSKAESKAQGTVWNLIIGILNSMKQPK